MSRFIKRNEHILYTGGAKTSPKDERDYKIPTSASIPIQPELDLREFVPEIKNQGMRNSCVSHAICSAIEFQLNYKDPERFLPLSELYNYYYGRIESGFPVIKDSGMFPRAAIKSAKRNGICPEILFTYPQWLNKEPGPVARSIAHIYGALIKQYYRVYSQEDIKKSLNMGIPVLFNARFYEYWYT